MKKRLLLPCLLILSALVLAACGGGGGSSDEGQIEEAIETSATTKDVSNCTKLQTPKFDEQGSQTEGKGAVKACEEELEEPNSKAESVEVSNVEVNGSKATAEAALTGGGFDGQTLEIALAKEGDQWKLDELVAFTKFDQAKLVEALTTEFEKDESVEPKLAECIEEGFGQASQSEVEKFILGGSSKPIEELAEGCVS